MTALDQAYSATISEKNLRRQIDLSVSRALVDSAYSKLLLADPTIVLGDQGCPPQQYLSLKSIQATTLVELSRQARQLFWAAVQYDDDVVDEEMVPVAVAAD